VEDISLRGVNGKNHDFLKYFQIPPKVLPDAAVNDYMNGATPPKGIRVFKFFLKKP
jgi:hypothetical protein